MGLLGPRGAIAKQLEIVRNRTKLSNLAKETINKAKDKNDHIVEADKEYDLVYILKESEKNPDLIMSLRSIEKFCTYRKVWIIGYKPRWLQNVEYIHTEQKYDDKWKNSCLNWKTACESNEISENFILMNDDFIALKKIIDWKNSLNVCLGNVQDEITKYGERTRISKWQKAFEYAGDLLTACHARTCYNYESHLPIIVNKKDYLEFLKLKPIEEFMETDKVLHKRTLYKNLFPDNTLSFPKKIKDVKIHMKYDLSDSCLKESWLSVFDGVIDNELQFPIINKFLKSMFSEKSKFEI